jgi:hypothetical protein
MKHQVRDLLDHRDRIGDAARVKIEPEGVDFRFERKVVGHGVGG